MSSGKGKDNPAAAAPSNEADGLLTSDDIFGEMLDVTDEPRRPQVPRAAPAPAPAPAPAEAARKVPIKVKVSEPKRPEKGPLMSDTPRAKEALPEDVAALLDAFSEPAEAATRAAPPARPPQTDSARASDAGALLDSLVEDP